jgi:hypothetical protein
LFTDICNAQSFRCSNGKCISGSNVCDNDNDCTDNSDENFCKNLLPKKGGIILYKDSLLKFSLGVHKNADAAVILFLINNFS